MIQTQKGVKTAVDSKARNRVVVHTGTLHRMFLLDTAMKGPQPAQTRTPTHTCAHMYTNVHTCTHNACDITYIIKIATRDGRSKRASIVEPHTSCRIQIGHVATHVHLVLRHPSTEHRLKCALELVEYRHEPRGSQATTASRSKSGTETRRKDNAPNFDEQNDGLEGKMREKMGEQGEERERWEGGRTRGRGVRVLLGAVVCV